MTKTSRVLVLLCGDILVFYLSLYLSLFLRHLEVPEAGFFMVHLVPFSLLFAAWLLVFTIAGLYDRRAALFRERLPRLIVIAQGVNATLAALFFFFTDFFAIAPKTTLGIYLGVSLVLFLVWRLLLAPGVGAKNPTRALLIGEGAEMEELLAVVGANPRCGIRFVHAFSAGEVDHTRSLESDIARYLGDNRVTMLVVDFRNPGMRALAYVLYNLKLVHPSLVFVDATELYEELFGRIPLSLLDHGWVLQHITTTTRPLYDALHRLIDVVIGLCVGAVALALLPVIALCIYLEDRGTVFIRQQRLGRYGTVISILKFRTMTGSDEGQALLQSSLSVTRVGAFLRASRLDELPQAWNILSGDLSFIGPRPEFPELVRAYTGEVPYYPARHLVKPGLTGWAQVYHEGHPHHGLNTEETKRKLSYDLYYLKHRSLTLYLFIALKTVSIILSRSGR